MPAAGGGSEGRGERLLGQTWWTALEERANGERDRVALRFSGPGWDRELRFGDWRDMSGAAARSLAALGVHKGDRVAALCSGSPVWPVLQMACSRLGAILVPLNSRYWRDELAYVIGRTEPKVLCFVERLGDVSVRDRLDDAFEACEVRPRLVVVPGPDVSTVPARTAPSGAAWHRELTWSQLLAPPAGAPGMAQEAVSPQDPVLMQFTSGTTAFPKGALLGSAATLRATYELGVRMGLTEADVMYSTQPMYHVGGSVATTLMAVTIGCTMVVPERYTVEETFRLVQAHDVTARTGQAAMYARELAHRDFRPEIFRTVTKGWSGGSPELKGAIVERMGISGLVSMYGLTEAAASTAACDISDPLGVRLATSGRVLPGLELAIACDGRMATRATGVGEICIRGWSLMVGYYRDAGATRGALDGDGWLHTGDLGRLDDGGFLHFVDRVKEMIKPGGENVSPAEVERVISRLAGVVQAAVVGMPDDDLGEVPVAFVETEPGSPLAPDDVIAYCARQMARFKVPRQVHVVTSWPMTESGKVSKAELRGLVGGSGLGWVGKTG